MKKLCLLLCGVFLLFTVPENADAALLTFDNITKEYDGTVQEYGGLKWVNVNVLRKDFFKDKFNINSGFENGVVSGTYVAVNDYARTASILSDGNPFTFQGTYLTAAWNTGLQIAVSGKLNGEKKYQRTITVDADRGTWFNINFSGIDELVFSSFGGTNAGLGWKGKHFVMDDFTYSRCVHTPIPSTVLLLISGLTGLAVLRKRFRTDL